MRGLVRFSALLCVLMPAVALAGRLDVTGVTASSTYPEEEGISYEPVNVKDGKASTSWIEGTQGSGLGEWIEVDLGGEKSVQKVKIWGGSWYSADYWKRMNRPKDIELQWPDGSKDSFTLKDEMKPQEFTLAAARKASTVKIRVKSIYDGTTWLDTAISEVQFFDAEPEKRATVRAYTSSSNAAADADGNYDPSNVGDGLVDSMWCEGNKAGDGTNEWIDFAFAGSTSVSKLTIVNGIGTSMAFWMKGNRAGTATLKFSDGSTETLTLKNTVLPQTLTFPAHTASSVRMTFSGIVKGKEFNDLCVSEAYFSE
jgi:hypothetical protein